MAWNDLVRVEMRKELERCLKALSFHEFEANYLRERIRKLSNDLELRVDLENHQILKEEM